MLQTYNFLIIGRCGSGKSATTRELTGSDNVEVRNSPNSVTRTINFYQSTPAKIERNKVSFSVLDIPGLDKIENRKLIRQTILREMQQRQIDFDAILYTVDCVTRDVIDNRKIFHFLNELPWSLRDTKQCLVPVLTKYDNLIFDAEDENTKQTLEEFGRIFEENNYGDSWKYNELYWVNTTKNIQRKMSICNEIKEVYETQIERLLRLLSRKKTRLTRTKIKDFLQAEHRYIQRKVKALIRSNQLVMRAASCVLNQQLTMELSRQKHTQNYTAATLGGMGMLLTKVVKNELGKVALAFGTILVTGCFIVRNLAQQTSLIKEKQEEPLELKMKFDNTYIIQKIYEDISASLRNYMQQIESVIECNTLVIHVPDKFQTDYFTIFKSAIAQCYLDDVRLERNDRGDFCYPFMQEEESHTVVAHIKLRFIVHLPEQQSLLEKFQQESYNFKKLIDLMY